MDQNDLNDSPGQATGPATMTEDEPVVASVGNVLPSFLAELARAMQAAAERERERIAEVIANDAADNAERTRTRAAAESDELRRLAEEDVERIRDWSTSEIKRIRQEADRRTDQRRNDLEAYLGKHETIIATEIEGLETAVRDYRATLDRFFESLTGSTDPTEIVSRAGSLPTPPDLDAVRAAARSGAVAVFANAPQDVADEPVDDGLRGGDGTDPGPSTEGDAGAEASADSAGLGVMDPDAIGRSEDLTAPLDEGGEEPEAEQVMAPPADALYIPADEPEEVAVARSVDHASAPVRLLRSIAAWTTSPERGTPDVAASPTDPGQPA